MRLTPMPATSPRRRHGRPNGRPKSGRAPCAPPVPQWPPRHPRQRPQPVVHTRQDLHPSGRSAGRSAPQARGRPLRSCRLPRPCPSAALPPAQKSADVHTRPRPVCSTPARASLAPVKKAPKITPDAPPISLPNVSATAAKTCVAEAAPAAATVASALLRPAAKFTPWSPSPTVESSAFSSS